ncbi:MAG: hypothetical protein KAJ25_00875 [Desulfobacula sp.]|uniref:hypothetical protein n=1 Tax=Desulfobacula sp. TaxID=2593537 RepID=UPI0025BCAFBE|nr:hypothetical protein [Desulfobacula sp.]MBC2705933.1 hypothetical protein [Desulfobacula sp.]MCK4768146.1 hypothetical protein [Desulfobacula sp.]MCK5347908.1 hypothetical protein [Desulfobacula sp.]
MNKDNEKRECFGVLEKVFPMTDKGLRQTPDDCFYHCSVKTKCLQQAMATKEGGKVEEEIIERGTQSGVINFFERWSRKKQTHRKIKK